LPIIQKLIIAYKVWHEYLIHLDKISRFSIGLKIDSLFVQTIENLFIASYKTKEQKTIYLNKASDVFDLVKFMLQVTWEIKALDNKKYIALSQILIEFGKMLGGWRKNNASVYRRRD